MIASTTKAKRQPEVAMMLPTIGERIAPPNAEPHSANDTAKPRFKLNQFVMMTETNRRAPAVMMVPESAASR